MNIPLREQHWWNNNHAICFHGHNVHVDSFANAATKQCSNFFINNNPIQVSNFNNNQKNYKLSALDEIFYYATNHHTTWT